MINSILYVIDLWAVKEHMGLLQGLPSSGDSRVFISKLGALMAHPGTQGSSEALYLHLSPRALLHTSVTSLNSFSSEC